MAGVIHTLLLVSGTIATSDAPPETGAEAEAALTQDPPPCTSPVPRLTPLPQASPRPCSTVDESPAPAVPEKKAGHVGWVEASHDVLERGLNALVLDLDRFFGDAGHEPYEPPTSYIRLRNELRTGQDDAVRAATAIAGYLRLPAASRMLARLRVFFAGETEPKPLPGPDVDLVPPRFNARVRSAGGGLELRVDLARGRRTLVDAGAGVRLGMPPPPFTRVRLAQGFPLGISVIGHLSQSVFWDRRQGFGETSRLDVERAFGTRTLARWWSTGTVDQVTRGFEWASEIGVQRVLGPRTGLFTAAAIAGATRNTAPVDRYRVYSRLRQDVYAGWAFVEVEPEIDWLADAVTSRRSRVVSATLRLELQFSSDGRKPTPLPPFRAAEPPT
jgi:hypothetical protein